MGLTLLQVVTAANQGRTAPFPSLLSLPLRYLGIVVLYFKFAVISYLMGASSDMEDSLVHMHEDTLHYDQYSKIFALVDDKKGPGSWAHWVAGSTGRWWSEWLGLYILT